MPSLKDSQIRSLESVSTRASDAECNFASFQDLVDQDLAITDAIYEEWVYSGKKGHIAGFFDGPNFILDASLGHVIHPGEIILVGRKGYSSDGSLYLKLACKNSWVCDRFPDTSPTFFRFDLEHEDERVDGIDQLSNKALGPNALLDPDEHEGTPCEFTRAGLSGWTCFLGCHTNGEPDHVVETIASPPSSPPPPPLPHYLTRPDEFDLTFTPRTFEDPATPRMVSSTKEQMRVLEGMEVPIMKEYPAIPGGRSFSSGTQRRDQLCKMFQDFVIDLHTGMYIRQVLSSHDHADIHCQLVKDTMSLRLDQCSGCIVEFPLFEISKFQHVRLSSGIGQVVVVIFEKRKLAFLFQELDVANRFQICMEILTRLAIEKKAEMEQTVLNYPFQFSPNLTRRRPLENPGDELAADKPGFPVLVNLPMPVLRIKEGSEIDATSQTSQEDEFFHLRVEI